MILSAKKSRSLLVLLVAVGSGIPASPLLAETEVRIREVSPSPSVTPDRDYEVIDGQSEIVGDPGLGRREGMENWKKACESWKERMEKMNASHQLIALDCNTAAYTIDNGQYTFRSNGTYKVRVRVRDGKPSLEPSSAPKS